jgi:hypothetical protein
VWSAIEAHIDQPGSIGEFVSVGDLPRDRFSKHPWSIGGGGAAELKEQLSDAASYTLGDLANSIGITAVTGEDDLYVVGTVATAQRLRVKVKTLVSGDTIRDWQLEGPCEAVWLYDDDLHLETLSRLPHEGRFLWLARRVISRRKRFGVPMLDRGLTWYEWQELYADKLRTPLSIGFAFVATHNHFVLDRGGKVFNRTAPVIKLPAGEGEDEHLGLVGLLNSSTACFWMKQVLFDRGNGGIGGGIASEDWERFYEHDSTKLQQFPMPAHQPLDLAKALDRWAQRLHNSRLARVLCRSSVSRADIDTAHADFTTCRRTMIALQEELDWRVYQLYGLLDEDLIFDPPHEAPQLSLGDRAFEIVLARKMAAGEVQTKWFERHGSTPITEIPQHWPAAYQALVARRIRAIVTNPDIGLIERPEHKRRWNDERWEEKEEYALREALLDCMEAPELWADLRLVSAAALADRLRADERFMALAELYRSGPDFDLARLVEELATGEAVPFLAAYRYTEAGMRKRAEWERTWDLQRREDAIDARTVLPATHPDHLTPAAAKAAKARTVGDIPVPPKFARADFRRGSYWSLRLKLDVPKERFVLYPSAERGADPTAVLGWAGWDHLQHAQALATFYVKVREEEAWPPERLIPLLAGLLELLPWLRQWHDEPDRNLGGTGMGTYFAGFLDEQSRVLGVTQGDLRKWAPQESARSRRRQTS